ncbi:MAG TPA: peptidoglycan DD-metalloendopeptidase family protein [Burkholderiales bacterium]|nr:peptidoglycan DD-metalloendopeptidase family protein [Burkholderiales bacterium]
MTRAAARPLAAAALVAIMVVALPGPAPAQTKDEELRALRGRIEALKKELAASEGARVDAADALRDSESAISEANRNLRELGAERDRLGGELSRLGSESRALKAQLDARQEQLGRALRARYLGGGDGYLRLVLSGDDPQRIARGLVYQTYLARAQADFIARTGEDLARRAGLESAAREKTAELAGVEKRARAERDSLVARAAERRQVLVRHADQIRKQRRDLETAQRNEARLAKLLEALARAVPPPAPQARRTPDPTPRRPAAPDAPATGAFGTLKGRLPYPVRGELAARFGASETAAAPSAKGVFIRAPGGADVKAVAAGRVVFADWMRGYGNLLILDHGDGFLSIYGNNESVLKRVGDGVHAGDAVATVGASGGGEASGLYFETRYQGRPFDPVPWLQPK